MKWALLIIKAEDIRTVGVIDAGILGEGIAQNFPQAGLSVRLVNFDEQILQRSLKKINGNLKLFPEFGLLEEEPSSIKVKDWTIFITELKRSDEEL